MALGQRHAGLLDWLDAPRTDQGLYFAEDGGGWTFWDYGRLAALVASAAEQIAAHRTAPAGPVAIVLPSGPQFVAAFMGALLAGHTPCPLAGPLFVRDTAQYVDHVAALLRTAEPVLVLAEPELEDSLREAAALAGAATPVRRLELSEAPLGDRRADPAELALLQFTSGSGGTPRAVRVTRDNLEANIAMSRRWLDWRPDDRLATWMPMYHDMGLIGCLLTPLAVQTDVWITRPDQFIRDPARWIGCLGTRGVEIAGGTNFAFAYAAKRLTDEQLEGMDFSTWRCAVVGAERLDPAALGGFAARLAPYGFRASAITPAYGMAEATLAISGVVHDEVARAVRIDWGRASFGAPVVVEEQAPLTDLDRLGDGAGWLVGCGPPLPGMSVSAIDDEGAEVGEGVLGELTVRGPSVAHGYLGTGGTTRFDGDCVLTADAGFLLDGEVFVMGRLGDSLKVRGRYVFAEDVESRLAALDGIAKGKAVVLAGPQAGSNLLAAVVEGEPGAWIEDAVGVLRSEVGDDARVQVYAGGSGTIQRTSSGKPRRRVMWGELASGGLEAARVYDSQSAS